MSKFPKHILRGHDAEVTCVALSIDLDVCVSGSKDTTAIIHTIKHGRYVRSLQHPNGCSFHKVVLSSEGNIVLFSMGDNSLCLFTINGHLLCTVPAGDTLTHMEATRDGNFLVTGGKQIIVRNMYDLSITRTLKLEDQARISYFLLSPGDQIFAALETQKLLLIIKEKPKDKPKDKGKEL